MRANQKESALIKDDYDYIIEIIRYLADELKIAFFITSKDFDVLYRWWEKRIPLRIVTESVKNVVDRRIKKDLPVTSFTQFVYEVKKGMATFMEMSVGKGEEDSITDKQDDINRFFNDFPPELQEIKSDLLLIRERILGKNTFDMEEFNRKILHLFAHNHELEVKTGLFFAPSIPGIKE